MSDINSLALALVPVQESSKSVFHQLCDTDRQIVERKRLDAFQLIQKMIVDPESITSREQDVISMKIDQVFHESLYPKIHLEYALQKFQMEDPSKNVGGAMEPNQVALRQKKPTTNVKSLKSAMEQELAALGISKLEMLKCHTCNTPYPTDLLFMITLPSKDHRKKESTTVNRCRGCWKGPLPSRTLYDVLIMGRAEQFAKNIGKRVEYLYGEWDERLTPMVKMLKENVLLAEDIEELLKGCTDPMEFNGTCDVIVLTTIAFYLDYTGFRRAAEALLFIKPTTTYAQLFELFSIFFPNRAKGIKTGDFL